MAANVYESRREVFVTPIAGIPTKYGFLTNVASAVGTSCGHTAVNRADPQAGLVFGANAPKPGRASKRRTNGVDSTFYDFEKRGALRTDGWSLTNPSIRRGRAGQASRAVYVTIGSIKYAWRMPLTTYTKIGGDREGLGIQDVEGSERDLVWGARFPKPPKASKYEVGTGGSDVLSTFVDPSRVDSLPGNWQISGREFILG